MGTTAMGNQMNCFDARREFRAFWRKELAAERRGAFVAHLAGCSACDNAFRNFALSAPVLHSAQMAERPSEDAPRQRIALSARRPAAAYRGRRQPQHWLSMSAAVVILMAGAFAAYLAVKTPVGNLSDVLSQSQPGPVPVAELFATQTPSSQGSHLAG